jgi:pimeloyl-ACP methyl ester carboxylesterase
MSTKLQSKNIGLRSKEISVRRVLLKLLCIVIGIVLLAVIVVLINSPGKLPPLGDAQGNIIEGAISEKVFVEIGGIEQGMFIRGENPDNPVLLYVHGGPGTPMMQFISYLETPETERLEKYFTVCYWEQRGSGMTYSSDTDPANMTIEQMVEDTREATEYLQKRFGQEKIYMMGHSWGTFLGVKTIEKYPENYLAYVGVGQVTNQAESEGLAYDYMLNRAKAENDPVATEFEKYSRDSYVENVTQLGSALKIRTSTMVRYGNGHLHKFPDGIKTIDGAILKSLFLFKGYTLGEKINWFRGFDYSMIHIWSLVMEENFFESSTKFEIPFYTAQGDYDYQVSQVLAKQYLETIDAPKKEYFAYADSAHSPNMEEPEKFVEMMRQIAAENPLLEVAESLDSSRLDSVEQSLEPYIQFGISLDRAAGLMMYDGKPVREIRDDILGLIITESAGPNGFGGRDISDAIDLTVVYEGDIPVGFRVSTQEEYDKNTEDRSK